MIPEGLKIQFERYVAMLTTIIHKLQESNPLKSALVRNLAWISPFNAVRNYNSLCSPVWKACREASSTVEDLQHVLLVGQRTDYDYMTSGQAAERHNFWIQKCLLLHCKGAHVWCFRARKKAMTQP